MSIITDEKFCELLLQDDPIVMAKALQNLEEKERKKLFRLIRPYIKSCFYDTSELLEENFGGSADRDVVNTAVLALGPLSTAKKADFEYFWACSDEECPVEITLAGRKPDWADKWLDSVIKYEFGISWETVHRLILAGLVERPSSHKYMALFGNGAFSDCFEKDSHLIENELWQLLNYEPRKSTSYRTTIVDGDRWSRIFSELIEKNLVCRGRLLSTLIKSLANPFRLAILRGFKECLDSFNPQLEEYANLQEDFVVCLGAKESTFVSFALNCFEDLQQSNFLNVDLFLQGAIPVFDDPRKAQPKKLLKLVKKIIKKHPDFIPSANQLLIEGLLHPEVEIQEAVTSILIKNKNFISLEMMENIQETLDLVSPVVYEDLLSITGETEDDSFEQDAAFVLPVALPEFSKRTSELMNIEQSFKAVIHGDLPPPVKFNFWDVTKIESASWSSVENHDDFLTISEKMRSERLEMVKFEKFFEFLSTSEFKNIISNSKASKIKEYLNDLPECISSPANIAALSYAFVGNISFITEKLSNKDKLLMARLVELHERITAGIKVIPLATPSYENLSLSPTVLIERLLKYRRDDIPVGRAEFAHALLRLNKESVIEAGEKALMLEEPYRSALIARLNNNIPLDCPFRVENWLIDVDDKNFNADTSLLYDRGVYTFDITPSMSDRLFEVIFDRQIYGNSNRTLLDKFIDEDYPWSTNLSKFTIDVDVLNAAILDGRWDDEKLINCISHYFSWDEAKIVGGVLKNTGLISPLHLYYCTELIDKVIVRYDNDYPRDFVAFLEVFYELLCQGNLGISQECRANLKMIKGSSKRAKIAKKISNLKEKQPIPESILAEAWHNRVERAKRWEEKVK